MILQNFHCHTSFCDGQDTPEEMVLEALDKQIEALGFSGHSYVYFDNCCMSIEGTEEYRMEVDRLRKKYADRIKIYCGIEQDIYSMRPLKKFDYSIGSVHYIRRGNEYYAVDDTPEILESLCARHFGGDYISLCEAYFETVSGVVKKTGCDIIGHLDLVTKFNEGDRIFDTSDQRYKNAWKQAVDELLRYKVPFEINTGAISRGYRTEPYPCIDIIRYISRNGGSLILSSDAHSRKHLLCDFGEITQKLEAEGIQISRFTDLKNI